jgi:hypothetical protein
MKQHWRTAAGSIALAGFALATVLASLALAGSAPATAQAPGKGGSSIGNSCINPIEIDKQTIVSDKEIRFTMRNGDVWTNHLPSACFGLKSEGGFEWVVRGTQVCSNQESIKVLRIGTPCLLGEFTKTPKAEKPAH